MISINRLLPMVILALLLASISSAPALADSSSLGRYADGVYPIFDSAVSMVDEDIRVNLEGDGSTALVECSFTFKNHEGPREVLMGFPALERVKGFNPEGASKELRKEMEALRLQEFTASINGREIETREENLATPYGVSLPPGTDYESWYTFTVPFEAGETKEVRNTYRVYFQRGNYYISTGYILTTGAFWRGPIGHARVTFDLGEVPVHWVYDMFPHWYFRFEGNRLIFERSEFEPNYDLFLHLYVPDLMLKAEEMDQEHGNAITEKINRHQELARFDRLGREGLLREYESALNSGDPIVTTYIQGRLPPWVLENVPPHISEVEVVTGNVGYFGVTGRIEDPNGDFAYWDLKISHIVNGTEVVDFYSRDRMFYRDENEKNIYTSGYIKLYPVLNDHQKKLEPGMDYLIEVLVWDAADQCDQRVISCRGEDITQQPPVEPGNRDRVIGSPQYEYSSGFFNEVEPGSSLVKNSILYLAAFGFMLLVLATAWAKRYRKQRGFNTADRRYKALGVIKLGRGDTSKR